MLYAVIASNSFSGSWMVDTILSQNPKVQVIGFSRQKEHDSVFLPYRRHNPSRFQFFQCDLNKDFQKLMQILDEQKPSAIINFAAQGEVGTSWRYPEDWYETNALAIVRLTNALKDRSYLKTYVQISTPEVYGSCHEVKEDCAFNPSSPYAASKASGDFFIQTITKQFKFPAIFIRSTNVYGAHQQLYRIIPRTILYLKMGKKIQLQGGGKAVKSYIHIQDVCLGIMKAMTTYQPGEVFHFSPEESVSIKDLVAKICKRMEHKFEDNVQMVEERPGQDACYIIDSSKARKSLGWRPQISLDQGIDETIRWVEVNYQHLIQTPLEYEFIPSV